MEYAANESCYNKPVVPLIPVLLAVQVDSVLSVRYSDGLDIFRGTIHNIMDSASKELNLFCILLSLIFSNVWL